MLGECGAEERAGDKKYDRKRGGYLEKKREKRCQSCARRSDRSFCCYSWIALIN
jgi:hypothetical protein